MSENSASINLTANLDGTDKVTAQLNSVTDAATRTSDKIAAGNEKSARSLKSLSNSLLRMRADAESLGDPITATLRKFELLHPDIDTSSLADSINLTRAASDVAKQYQADQREMATLAARAAKEHENLAKQIEIATAKAKEGVASTSAGYFRQLAQERNVNLTGKDNVNLAELEKIQQSNARTAALVKQADADAKRIASESRSFFSQIQSGIDHYATANMSLSEKLAYQIQAAGHNLQNYKPQLDQLKVMEQQSKQAAAAAENLDGAMMKNGVTTKQYAAALRGVPAQMTDIVVSLASGQAPLTVLLQQGGQLKDMFGGVGGAVKALGDYLMGLVNPLTVAGTVLGTLTYAMYSAESEVNKFENILIRTRGAAGNSAEALIGLCNNVAAVTGYTSEASAAVEKLAASGKLSFKEIESSARAMADYIVVTGQKADKVSAKFEKAFENPIEGAKVLNEKFNFLTEAVARQIVSLQKHGRTTEAAALLMREAGAASEEARLRMVANAGPIEAAWHGIKEAIVGAWQALVQFYAKSREVKINEAYDDRIAQMGAIGQLSAEALEKEESARKAALAEANKQLKTDEKRVETARKVNKILTEGAKALRSRNRKSGAGKTSPEVSEYENLTKTIQQRTEALKQEIQYGNKLSEADKLRIQIENNSVNSKKKLTDAHKQVLLAKVAELKALEQERDLKKFDEDNAKAKEKLIQKYQDQFAVLGMGTKEAEAYKEEMDILRKSDELYKEAAKKGVTADQLAHIREETQRLIDRNKELKRQYEEAFNDPYKALIESVRKYRDEAFDTGRQIRDAYKNAFSGMEDAFVQFVTTGKLSFRSLVNSILEDVARMMAKRYVSNFLEGILSIGGSAFSSWFGNSGVTASMENNVRAANRSGIYQIQTSGQRASGGPVTGGNAYLVGERGPELFVPSQSGRVVSNDDLTGKNGLGVGGFNIQISHRNEGTRQQVTDSGADFDGRNLIIKIVTQDIANDGMISRTMSRTFGMRRAAGAM